MTRISWVMPVEADKMKNCQQQVGQSISAYSPAQRLAEGTISLSEYRSAPTDQA